MKKLIFISLLFTVTSVTAAKTYLLKNYQDELDFITESDNYNYENYILESNQILVVPPELGILSNDIIKNTNYKIVVLENSKNSKLKDLEINETTGSFSYEPSTDVVGEVSFKYYIEYEDNKTNISYINFYVKTNNKNNKEKIPNTGI
jgi:hypothetical protein